MKKPAKNRKKQNSINAALMNSLGQHKAVPDPKMTKTTLVTKQGVKSVTTAPKVSTELVLDKPATVTKKGASTKPRSQTRHSILLNEQDNTIIRRVRMELLSAGHDNVNMSRILRMGLRLLPEKSSVLLESYERVSAEDMRLKR